MPTVENYLDSIDERINTKIAGGIKQGLNLVLNKIDTLIEDKVDLLLEKKLPALEKSFFEDVEKTVFETVACILEDQKMRREKLVNR